MDYDYNIIAECFKPITCVISVERFADGSFGNIRIVSGNSAFSGALGYFDKIDPNGKRRTVYAPDLPYENYIHKAPGFEDLCIRCAFNGETLHTYLRPERIPFWLDLTLIPLHSDKENIGYCLYTHTISEEADYSLMTNISPDITAQVLKICIKLRDANDFNTTMDEVISDIRDLCDAGHCCVLLTDFGLRKCSVLCEALSKTTHLLSMKKYVNDDFFEVVDTWQSSLSGTTSVIIKDENDWEYLKEHNPVWYNSMHPAGAESIVLFPLKVREETLGYIWAINFNVAHTVKIKEMLELTTYFLASEIANHQLFTKLEMLSSKDLLTGVFNRNAMNNRIDKLMFSADGRVSEQSVGIIFADVNGLKLVNDTDGHFSGDLLLKDAALMLQRHCPDFEIYRAGGDEFMVLAFDITEDKLKDIAQKLSEAASDPAGVCMAVGWCYDKVSNISKAMRSADEKMYENKQLFYRLHPERKRAN